MSERDHCFVRVYPQDHGPSIRLVLDCCSFYNRLQVNYYDALAQEYVVDVDISLDYNIHLWLSAAYPMKRVWDWVVFDRLDGVVVYRLGLEKAGGDHGLDILYAHQKSLWASKVSLCTSPDPILGKKRETRQYIVINIDKDVVKRVKHHYMSNLFANRPPYANRP